MGKLVQGRAKLGVGGTVIICEGLISTTSESNWVDSAGRDNCFFIGGRTGGVGLGNSCRCLLTFPGRCVVGDDSDAFRFGGPRPKIF